MSCNERIEVMEPEDIADMAETCLQMWWSCLKWYVLDARSYAVRGRAEDKGEAYFDLHGDGAILAYLCEVLGLNLEVTRRGILGVVAMQQQVP